MKRDVIVITGQTATGKTAHALHLARQNSGELINADSRQIYKYLNIITGKDIAPNSPFQIINPNLALDKNRTASIGYYPLDDIKIWAYDLVDPKVQFSSYDYTVVVNYILRNAIEKNKLPIVVGGSYLYLKHLIYGFDAQIPPDWTLRNGLEELPVAELRTRLNQLDLAVYEQMNPSDQKNPRRLIRKIEIASVPSKRNPEKPAETSELRVREFIGLRFKKQANLAEIIKNRVEKRLKQGALAEVEALLAKGYQKTDPGLQTIGYQQIISYLEKKISYDEAISQWITAEVQYAKRQYAFMKKDLNITWI